jgi:hypothetical protein
MEDVAAHPCRTRFYRRLENVYKPNPGNGFASPCPNHRQFPSWSTANYSRFCNDVVEWREDWPLSKTGQIQRRRARHILEGGGYPKPDRRREMNPNRYPIPSADYAIRLLLAAQKILENENLSSSGNEHLGEAVDFFIEIAPKTPDGGFWIWKG